MFGNTSYWNQVLCTVLCIWNHMLIFSPTRFSIHWRHVNPLNAELNPICHLLALLGAHLILHVSGLRVKGVQSYCNFFSTHLDGDLIIIVIIINIKDWTLWSVPSPELQLLAPTLLRSSNCSPSLWSVVVWFQRDSMLWHSLQVWKPVPSVFIYLV